MNITLTDLMLRIQNYKTARNNYRQLGTGLNLEHMRLAADSVNDGVDLFIDERLDLAIERLMKKQSQ